MNAYQWGQLGGAFFSSGILTAILYGGAASWPSSTAKVIFINTTAAILAVLLQAVGHGISAQSTPSFSTAPFCVVAQIVIALFIFLFISFRRNARQLPPRDRIEPRF
jgi:hypothetical protein